MIQLWPAIDLIEGKPVRLLQGDFDRKTEYDYPLEHIVETFNQFASGIHVVDLDGARSGSPMNLKAIEKILKHAEVPVEVGGGIRDHFRAEIVLNLGVKRVVVGTTAVQDENLMYEMMRDYGRDRIVIGIDVKDEFVAVEGWEKTSDVRVADFLARLQDMASVADAEHQSEPIRIIYTDIASDGMLTGPPFETFSELTQAFPAFRFIASGGVSRVDDIKKLSETGVEAVIFGKAFYDGKITLHDLLSSDN